MTIDDGENNRSKLDLAIILCIIVLSIVAIIATIAAMRGGFIAWQWFVTFIIWAAAVYVYDEVAENYFSAAYAILLLAAAAISAVVLIICIFKAIVGLF